MSQGVNKGGKVVASIYPYQAEVSHKGLNKYRIVKAATQYELDQKTAALTMRLVFASQRYDKGLDQIVPCSQNVKVIEDHHHMKDFYLSFKGREIYLPIELTAVERNVYYKTTADGKPLMLEEKQLQKTA